MSRNLQNLRWPLAAENQSLLCRYFRRLLRCDHVRLSSPLGHRIFLITGTKRNTKQDPGIWKAQNGHIKNWDYLAETCVASGNTIGELMTSAKQYKKISGLTALEAMEQGYV